MIEASNLHLTFSSNRFKYLLLLVVLTHLVVLSSYVPKMDFDSSNITESDKNVIKMKIITNAAKAKQIVDTSRSKHKLDVKKARFLSEKANTFARETKAATIAAYKDAGFGAKTNGNELVQENAKRKEKKKVSFSDLAVNGPQAPKTASAKKRKVLRRGLRNGSKKTRGLSQSRDFIEDVPLGDFTKLNTQEFEFYGFYHRIRQKLEQFWGLEINEKVKQIYKQGRSLASDSNHITSLDITMNSRGEIIGIAVKATSGVRELDDVAVEAFNKAGPFPNPPKKMLKNGQVTVSWSFNVTT